MPFPTFYETVIFNLPTIPSHYRVSSLIFPGGMELEYAKGIMGRMKVAIPVFGLQVSPRCDYAPEILFVEFENGEIVSRKMASMEGLNSLQRLRTISTSGVTVLVCGAVTGFYQRMLDSFGIQIMHAEGMTIDALLERIRGSAFSSAAPCRLRGRRKGPRAGCPRVDAKALEFLLESENPQKGD